MKLVVDGVFYQIARSGIGRVWSSILPRLSERRDLEIILLDRGGCPQFPGITNLPFPSYSWLNTPADSFLIDQFCRDCGADVFASTYYTTPVSVPAVQMIYDMIPEVFAFDAGNKAWEEKKVAIAYASYYACISNNTLCDLKRFHPYIDDDRLSVAYCGVEPRMFHPREKKQIDRFKERFQITRPYFLTVGHRKQAVGYKNFALLLSALRRFRPAEIEVLCIGGEAPADDEEPRDLPANVTLRQIDLDDDELACAYSGAEALVYPSLYEGFGLPVIEAMACGCPVITTKLGSLGEVAGDAAIFISGHDDEELRHAMASVRSNWRRQELIEKGLRRAALYDWDEMAREVHALLGKAAAEKGERQMQEFLANWARLRALQAEVDPGDR